MTVRIMVGDALSQLATLPDGSVHCVVTSPPYWGLRAYKGDPGMIGLEPTVNGGARRDTPWRRKKGPLGGCELVPRSPRPPGDIGRHPAELEPGRPETRLIGELRRRPLRGTPAKTTRTWPIRGLVGVIDPLPKVAPEVRRRRKRSGENRF